MRFVSAVEESRGGKGRSRNARERASATERTAEIRRQASRMPQYFGTPFELRTESEAVASAGEAGMLAGMSELTECPSGEAARYSGLPTRNAVRCDGVAARMSSQNLYICGSSSST